MIISDLTIDADDDAHMLRATILWEQANRPAMQLYFRIPSVLAPTQLSIFADALLVGCYAPALAAGETRLSISTAICPRLKSEIASAFEQIGAWFPDEWCRFRSPQIDAPVRERQSASPQSAERGAVSLFSGGVDSTHLILQNIMDFPDCHPGRIRHAAMVYGLDLGGRQESWESERPAHQRVISDAQEWLPERNIEVARVETNLRHLDDRPGFWGHWFAGASLAAISILLQERASAVLMASSGGPLMQTFDGTSPIVVRNMLPFGTNAAFPYTGIMRYQRLRLIANHIQVLKRLRVCLNGAAEQRNCGRCEKCVRTATALLLMGIEPRDVFSDSYSKRQLESIDIASESTAVFYREMLGIANQTQQADLAQMIDDRLQSWERYKKWKSGQTVGGWIRRLKMKIKTHRRQGAGNAN